MKLNQRQHIDVKPLTRGDNNECNRTTQDHRHAVISNDYRVAQKKLYCIKCKPKCDSSGFFCTILHKHLTINLQPIDTLRTEERKKSLIALKEKCYLLLQSNSQKRNSSAVFGSSTRKQTNQHFSRKVAKRLQGVQALKLARSNQ